MEVLRVEDSGPFAGGGTEPPKVMGEYVPRHIPERIRAASRREPLKPLHITQPEGPSFTLDGNLLRWQNWSLRVGFNYREGMTLHTVRYQRRRPGPLDRAPDVVRGDGGAVPGLVGRPLPAHRVRHRRVGAGLHDARPWNWAATAWARSAISMR